MNSPPAYAAAQPSIKLLINDHFVESKATDWHDVIKLATQEGDGKDFSTIINNDQGLTAG